MPAPAFIRVYVEVVTREDLETPQSIEDMLFQLCEHLDQHSAVVQLHVVDRTDSLPQLAAGSDAIPEDRQLEVRVPGSAPELGHAANLHFACNALRGEQSLNLGF